MGTHVAPWRKIIQEQLELLASEAEQLEYEANVPHVDVTSELVAGWFSDSYHPNDAKFAGCFSDAELHALGNFNRQFDAALNVLPQSMGSVRNWLCNSEWRGVMNGAAQARSQIAG